VNLNTTINVTTPDFFDFITMFFEECYEVQDSQGDILDTREVCARAEDGQIECYSECIENDFQCPDSDVFDCMTECGLEIS